MWVGGLLTHLLQDLDTVLRFLSYTWSSCMGDRAASPPGTTQLRASGIHQCDSPNPTWTSRVQEHEAAQITLGTYCSCVCCCVTPSLHQREKKSTLAKVCKCWMHSIAISISQSDPILVTWCPVLTQAKVHLRCGVVDLLVSFGIPRFYYSVLISI